MTHTPQPVGAPDRARYLAELSTLGGYFALTSVNGHQWQCISTLFTDVVLTDHVDRTRAAIAASAGCPSAQIPIRMAASSFQLGVAARLLSPVIGGALSLGAVPILDAQTVRWAPSGGHAPQFAVAETAWTPVRSTTAAQVIMASVLPVLIELGDRLNALVALSPRITLGNLTSAANGAVTVLAMSRPHLDSPGRALVRALLAIEPLTGTGAFVGGRFRRRSCCLYYQAPESGLCGDCVLTQNPGRSSAT